MKENNKYIRKSLAAILIVIALANVVSGCKKSTTYPSPVQGGNTPVQGANDVFIQNMAFSPSTITVAINTTVKWTNMDAVTHNVTSATGVFSSGSLGTNSTFSHQFTTAGTFPYTCTIHPFMIGTVVVH